MLRGEAASLVAAATLSAFLGTWLGAWLGKRLLKKVTLRLVELSVAALMVVISTGLACRSDLTSCAQGHAYRGIRGSTWITVALRD